MMSRITRKRLKRLMENAQSLSLKENRALVIFSDLHMGDGSRVDDFRGNALLLSSALRGYYLEQEYTLVLNGDIEELQRFSKEKVRKRWKEMLGLFLRFQSGGGLFRLEGNHDMTPGVFLSQAKPPVKAMKLEWRSGNILILHGHQASFFGPLSNRILGLGLRYLASPLGIRNYTVAFNSHRKYRFEKRIYDFARQHRILAVMGHTHRPLFESLSRLDTLKMKIEQACRRYAREREDGLEGEILHMKEEYLRLLHNHRKYAGHSMLYHSGPLVPCLFNSGSGIGPGGITAIEITDGMIALVLWFHRSRNPRYLEVEGRRAIPMGDSDIYRVVLKQDSLDYMFTRIHLLS